MSRRKVNEPNMRRAIAVVNRGLTYCAAAIKQYVNHSTLHRRVNGPSYEPARGIARTETEEDIRVEFLANFANQSLSLTQTHLGEAMNIMFIRMDLTPPLLLL